MPQMPSRSYLVKRGDRYYYRRRVPSDVADQLGIREIKESLGTGDRKLASAEAARKDQVQT